MSNLHKKMLVDKLSCIRAGYESAVFSAFHGQDDGERETARKWLREYGYKYGPTARKCGWLTMEKLEAQT